MVIIAETPTLMNRPVVQDVLRARIGGFKVETTARGIGYHAAMYVLTFKRNAVKSDARRIRNARKLHNAVNKNTFFV